MVMNLCDFEMNLQEAVAAPRISFIEPDVIAVENKVPESVREALSAMGHNIRMSGGLGSAHALAILYDKRGIPRSFEGAADPRARGLAKGY
jgi:gamma-glutamyltranspeptidase